MPLKAAKSEKIVLWKFEFLFDWMIVSISVFDPGWPGCNGNAFINKIKYH